MRAQIILEWKLFINNIKNRVVFVIVIFICLFGAFVSEANFDPLRAVDINTLEAEVEDAEFFLENENSEENPRMTQMFLNVMAINPPLIDAIHEKDWETVMEEEQNHYQHLVVNRYEYEGGYIDPMLYEYGEPLYAREIRQNYYDGYHAERYENYANESSELSISVLEERTTLQAIVRHLQDYLPVIIIIMVILYTVDIFSKDQQHLSIVQNVPLSKYKNSWAKSLVILTATTLTLLIGFIVFSIPVTMQNGFGSFNMPIPIYGGTTKTIIGTSGFWVSKSVGIFLVQAIILLYLVSILFIRFLSWINKFISEAFINLLVLPFVFIRNIWHRPGVTYATSAFKSMMPSLVNQFILALKNTSVLSVIGMVELTTAGQIIISRTYQSGNIWLIVGAIYIILITVLTKLSEYMEKRLDVSSTSSQIKKEVFKGEPS